MKKIFGAAVICLLAGSVMAWPQMAEARRVDPRRSQCQSAGGTLYLSNPKVEIINGQPVMTDECDGQPTGNDSSEWMNFCMSLSDSQRGQVMQSAAEHECNPSNMERKRQEAEARELKRQQEEMERQGIFPQYDTGGGG